MIYNLAATPTHQGSTPRSAGDGFEAPAALDPRVVGRVRKNYGNSLPVIFDLPPAQAVPRASEFAKYVQPIVLQNCGRCHNEKYPGDVPARPDQEHPGPPEPRHRPGQPRRHGQADQPRRPGPERAALGGPGPPRPEQERDLQRPERPDYRSWPPGPGASAPPDPQGARAEAVTRTGFSRARPPRAGDGFGADRGGAQGRAGPPPSPPAGARRPLGRTGRGRRPRPGRSSTGTTRAPISGRPRRWFPAPYSAGGLPPIPPRRLAPPPAGPGPRPRPTPPVPASTPQNAGHRGRRRHRGSRQLPGMKSPFIRARPGPIRRRRKTNPRSTTPSWKK